MSRNRNFSIEKFSIFEGFCRDRKKKEKRHNYKTAKSKLHSQFF